jgi:hypothetical protein
LFGAAAALAAWNAVLYLSALRTGRTLTLEMVPRKQHYIQACAQGSVLLYWGWYWREVYDSAHLIAAQLIFAYAFDMLVGWSRRDAYTLGFGPFPVIFSINLFLWFKPDWFYLQFLMVALGFAVKERSAGTKAAGAFTFQSLVVSSGRVFSRPDSLGQERPHVGPGHREHAVLSAAHARCCS